MAMVNCPECGREVSRHAETCPGCGLKLDTLTAGLLRFKQRVETAKAEKDRDPAAFEARMAELRAKRNPNINVVQAISLIVLLFMAVGAWLQFVEKPKEAKAAAEKAAAAAEEAKKNDPRERKINRFKASLDSWDGAPKKLKELIKQGMNDPDSFNHDRIDVNVEGEDYLVITEHFMAKNAFGGVVRNWAKAKVDLDGNVLEIYKTSADE